MTVNARMFIRELATYLLSVFAAYNFLLVFSVIRLTLILLILGSIKDI